MIGESLLKQARLRKGWTLAEAAAAVNVSVTTQERWEKGLAQPHGPNLQALCKTYDASPEDLGFPSGEIYTVAISEETKADAFSDFSMRLYIMALAPRRSLYEVQYELRRILEASVKDEITRRDALWRLTWMPLLGLLAGNAAPAFGRENVTQFAAAIAACWELSKGDGQDMKHSYQRMNEYLPILRAHLQGLNAGSQRQALLTLIAQCYHFKTVTGWHLESLRAAQDYAHLALHYSTLAEDVPLQIEGELRLADIYYFSKQYRQAYSMMCNAEARIKASSVPLPPLLVSHVYSFLSVLQAMFHQKNPALSSLELAHQHFHVYRQDEAAARCFVDHSAAGLANNDGLTHAYLGMPDQALDSLSQVINAPAAAVKQRTRVLAYNDQVLALLNSPKKDMERTIPAWITSMQGATALKSEQRWQEAMENYTIMRAVWPGEKRIEELHDLAVHW